jgi:hypothetical protein
LVPAAEEVPLATKEGELRREAIRRTLLQCAGDAPDANAVAEAAISTWHKVAARIVPVIGVGGSDVLFNRSLHLTCMAFPWLTIVGDHRDSIALLANLKERLAGSETDAATEASYNLLVTFTELLTSLIGESLSERLLGTVLVASPPASEQETAL